MNREVICFDAVAPARERGLKYYIYMPFLAAEVAPARERGLKYIDFWGTCSTWSVAPARERGLKSCQLHKDFLGNLRRSREGRGLK